MRQNESKNTAIPDENDASWLLRSSATKGEEHGLMMDSVSIRIASENDTANACFQAREIAKSVGFGSFEQTLISMAVNELARGMLLGGHAGTIEIETVSSDGKRGVRVRAITEKTEKTEKVAAGVASAPQGGAYVTGGGLGGGLAGIQRLMDEFSVESDDDKGATVEVLKWV